MSAVLKPNGFPYNDTFRAMQATVRSASTIPAAELATALESYNFSQVKEIVGSDEQLYKMLVAVVFYSGVKAALVTARMSRIEHYFEDFRAAAEYSEAKVQEILSDEDMLKHPQKVEACIKNARRFTEILKEHKSVADYFNTFGPFDVDANVQRFRDALLDQFGFLGEITVYHYMMDMALNVAKPDRVLQRVFHRLGLVGDPHLKRNKKELRQYYWDTLMQARKFAAGTGENIRVIDINIMAFGQQEIVEFGLKGTCLEASPKCQECKVEPFCEYNDK